MLKWQVKNGDDKLRSEIERVKAEFDGWYKNHWEKNCSREKMLSENSPVTHIYYKMTKTFKEIKEKYPYEALKQCSSCGKYVNKWIETEFSFCNEYGCGMSLCKECAEKIAKKFNSM
jgi:hypothetical protein